MGRFYELLKNGKHKDNGENISTAQAFARAQRETMGELINDFEEEYHHPYFWAPFLGIGDWR